MNKLQLRDKPNYCKFPVKPEKCCIECSKKKLCSIDNKICSSCDKLDFRLEGFKCYEEN